MWCFLKTYDPPLVTICMPAFNEASAIQAFLTELFDSFSDTKLSVIVVNDCSTDSTGEVLTNMQVEHSFLSVIHNDTNLGHGTSTLLGLETAASYGGKFIVSCDGDGHVSGSDLRKLLSVLLEGNFDIVEGVRFRPKDKWFRKLVSLATRYLVWRVSGSSPKDANTPFRAYRISALLKVKEDVPLDSLVPNLLISRNARQMGLRVREEVVVQISRLGAVKTGSTWNQKYSLLPSRRFLSFCFKAIGQWSSRSR